MLPPLEFIPLAEETGLILPVGEWVLQEACRELRSWRESFPEREQLFVNVNLSVKQLASRDLIGQIHRVLQATRLAPESLNLEITESVMMEHRELARTSVDQFKAIGLGVHMDDFGTGYSSLSYLHNLPIDALKVDRSFVTNMGANGENVATVQAVITLAHNQGMKVIAEGVETVEQMVQLQSMNCDLGQGFYLSRPLGVEAAGRLLASGQRWLASA